MNVDDGGMLAFVFAGLTMLAVNRAAEDIIFEVREQFSKEPRLRDRDWESNVPNCPDYERCVTIATQSAILEMVTPAALAVFSPFVAGYMLGTRCLAGVLVGNVTSGILLAVTMANAGGAWDNAKKFVQGGGLGDEKWKYGFGHEWVRTSFHEATIVGDTGLFLFTN